MAHDDQWSGRAPEQREGGLHGLLWRRDRARGEPPLGTARLATGRCRECLNLVREHQVRDAAMQDGALACQVHQLGEATRVEDRLTPLRDLAEGGLKVDFLESARPQHLRVDLPRERQHRRTVHVRIPEPGQQICRAGACDAQAGRGAAGELAVGRRGEGRGPFVANPDVAQGAPLLLNAQRVGQAQVRVAHHPEDPAHSPVGHGLGHHVADRLDLRLILLQLDVDAVRSHVDGERGDAVIVATGRRAAQGIEVPAVPGTAQQTLLDRPLTERSALVRTLVIECGVLSLVVGEAQRPEPACDRLDAAFFELVGLERFVPDLPRHCAALPQVAVFTAG